MASATTTAEERPAAVRRSRPLIPRARRASKSFLLTFVATVAVAAFLAGKELLSEQSFDVHEAFSAGETLVASLVSSTTYSSIVRSWSEMGALR